MKKVIKKMIYKSFRLFYSGCNLNGISIKKLLLFIFVQKIVGINRKVPWPVHFTSLVKGYDKIVSKTEIIGFAFGNYIDGRNGIIVEENVWLGPNVCIISQNHDLTNFERYLDSVPIKIGKNSILLAGSVILPGVELGEHTVVAAGAIVTHSFTQGNILLGGNPAKIIKNLNAYEL